MTIHIRSIAITDSGGSSFYRDGDYLGTDGRYHPIPAE